MRGVNWSCRGGSVTVKVSRLSSSKLSPPSPGANKISKFWTIVEARSAGLTEPDSSRNNCMRLGESQYYYQGMAEKCVRLPDENGKQGALSVPISALFSSKRSGMKASACCHQRGSLWTRETRITTLVFPGMSVSSIWVPPAVVSRIRPPP